ncbi:MAG: hypothetical protein Q9167_006787 [Letrouitia subvulpina]
MLGLRSLYTVVIPLFAASAICYRHGLPTPTLAGLKAAQVEFEVRPTYNPWSPSEIFKRFAGDPGICGWVEGDSDTGALFCEGQYPYCATYRYASGSQGYGCAATKGYNKTVLTATAPGATPFGQSASATLASSSTASSSSSSYAVPSRTTSSATSSPVNMGLISGGAIAGAVAGSVLALAAVVGIIVFFLRRHRNKKEQERLDANRSLEMSSRADRYVYANYAKPSPGLSSSPPLSPPMHSRQPSDHMFMFGSSPPPSEHDGRPFSPESVSPRIGPVELEGRDDKKSGQK